MKALKRSTIIAVVITLVFFQNANAQTIPCGTDKINGNSEDERHKTKDLQPGYDVSKQEFHVIPVVVHNFYDTFQRVDRQYPDPNFEGPLKDSLSPSLIKSQIEALNDHFGRSGAYKEVKVANGADTRIRFCLAKRDPEGEPTNGINHLLVDDASLTLPENGASGSRSEMQIKNQSRWPTDRYLNIWVVRAISNNEDNRRVQGFAYLPPNAANEDMDGVVLDHRYFGRNNPRNNLYQGGKTTTHEVGHYLNLFHPWGRSRRAGCAEDDKVDDTPLCKNPFEKVGRQACEPDPTKHECRGFDRMTSNYMEYSIDRCMKAFTAGQTKRMRKAIADYRSKLVSFTNVQNAGCIKTFDTLNSRDTLNEEVYPQVNAFPNPATDKIFINTLAKANKVLTATLYNTNGQLVKRQGLSEFRTGRIILNVNDLQPGIYILKVAFDQTVKQQRIVIHR